MLRNCGIQGKLQITLGLLCAVVLTLAIGGLQWIYAYRELATNVSNRASELPITSSLTRDVESLRNQFHQISSASAKENPLTPLSITDLRDQFREGLATTRANAEDYRQQLEMASESDTILSDREDEKNTMKLIIRRLDSIESKVSAEKWAFHQIDYGDLKYDLDELAQHAQELPTFLQERMANLREDVRDYYRFGMSLVWACTILAAGLFIFVIFLFHRVVVKPFNQLLAGCRTIGEDFDHRIDLGTEDELNELARSMNDMATRFQEKESELRNVIAGMQEEIRNRTNEAVRNEQLASVGFLAAGVAHEINNPLASIAWSAEALESRLHDHLYDSAVQTTPLSEEQLESLRENLRRVQDEAFRCKEITEQLLDFSRLGSVKREPTDLKNLVEDVAAMVGTLGQYRCKKVRLDCPSIVSASVNGQEIKQVALNLMTNALESVDSDGAVDIRLRQRGDVAVMTVEDDGCGMDDNVLENLFEPFFTSGKEGQGTGLGLSISYRIVQQHGGRMTAHSEGPGRGARLEVTLPIENYAESNVTKQVA